MNERTIILASKSPRRKKMLEQIGLKFIVKESDYEEDMSLSDDSYELCKILALKKTEDVAKNFEDAIVIGADTFVIFENKFIAKPKNHDDAVAILNKLSGQTHEVVTGFAIIDTKKNIAVNDYGKAKVRFRKLTGEEIEDYIATGEPFDKAGGYGIQGKAAALIESIDGDFYSIVGLPLAKIFVELKKLGVKAFCM